MFCCVLPCRCVQVVSHDEFQTRQGRYGGEKHRYCMALDTDMVRTHFTCCSHKAARIASTGTTDEKRSLPVWNGMGVTGD